MNAPLEKAGIRSELLGVLTTPDGSRAIARVRFRMDNSGLPPEKSFPAGDWLDVSICARVYDAAEVNRLSRIPDSPLAQGPEITATARTDWSATDLELPPLPWGEYIFVAKVYSRDDRYRKSFDPSNCVAFVIRYGFRAA
jgi:hypothetical protein